jgi:hypothetical protein
MLKRINSGSISQVKLYGRLTGDEFPAWNRDFAMTETN